MGGKGGSFLTFQRSESLLDGLMRALSWDSLQAFRHLCLRLRLMALQPCCMLLSEVGGPETLRLFAAPGPLMNGRLCWSAKLNLKARTKGCTPSPSHLGFGP